MPDVPQGSVMRKVLASFLIGFASPYAYDVHMTPGRIVIVLCFAILLIVSHFKFTKEDEPDDISTSNPHNRITP